MFYRENLERIVEKTRDEQLRAVCRVIYNVVCTVIVRYSIYIVHTFICTYIRTLPACACSDQVGQLALTAPTHARLSA